MSGECVEYDKSASHQFDDGTSDMDDMGDSLMYGVDSNDMDEACGWWQVDGDSYSSVMLANMTDNRNTYERMYGPLTYLDFLLKASEDLVNFDIIGEYRRPAQVRYAALLIQQAVEKTHKGLLTHDGYQQDLRTHDITQLVDECRNKCDVSRITVPSEIAENSDDISGWYRRNVKCLPSDEVVSRVHDCCQRFWCRAASTAEKCFVLGDRASYR